MTTSKVPRQPFELIADQTRTVGSIALKAKLSEGRRTIAYVGFRPPSNVPIVVREVKKGVDADTFTLELEYAGALKLGAPLESVIEQGGKSYAIAPAVVGESLGTILAHAIESKVPVPLGVALAIAARVADQLENIEDNGAHGDLVPEHVLVGYDGHVHVIDPAGEAHRERAALENRAGYRSPEHVDDVEISRASDLFSLGILLYELTTAQRVFGDPKEAATKITSTKVPIDLQLIIRKLLRPAVRDRFADTTSARDALSISALAERHATDREIALWMQATFKERFAAWQSLVGPDQMPSLSAGIAAPLDALDEALGDVASSVQGELALLLQLEEQGDAAVAPEDELAKQFLPQPAEATPAAKPSKPATATAAPLPSKPTPTAPAAPLPPRASPAPTALPPRRAAPSAAAKTAPPAHVPSTLPPRSPRPDMAAASSPLGISKPPMDHGEPAVSLPGSTATATASSGVPPAPTPAPQNKPREKSVPSSSVKSRGAPAEAVPSATGAKLSPANVQWAASLDAKPASTPAPASPEPSLSPAQAPASKPAQEALPSPEVAPTALAVDAQAGAQQKGMLIAIAILLVLLGLGGLYLYMQATHDASTTAPSGAQTRVLVRALPTHATLTVGGREYPHETYVEVGATEVQVTAQANGYRPKTVTIRPGQTDNELIVLTKQP